VIGTKAAVNSSILLRAPLLDGDGNEWVVKVELLDFLFPEHQLIMPLALSFVLVNPARDNYIFIHSQARLPGR
jgi:hypothetical protein